MVREFRAGSVSPVAMRWSSGGHAVDKCEMWVTELTGACSLVLRATFILSSLSSFNDDDDNNGGAADNVFDVDVDIILRPPHFSSPQASLGQVCSVKGSTHPSPPRHMT